MDASKQLSFEVLPAVLILHLKRFVYDNVGGTMKSYKRIEFPSELDILPGKVKFFFFKKKNQL